MQIKRIRIGIQKQTQQIGENELLPYNCKFTRYINPSCGGPGHRRCHVVNLQYLEGYDLIVISKLSLGRCRWTGWILFTVYQSVCKLLQRENHSQLDHFSYEMLCVLKYENKLRIYFSVKMVSRCNKKHTLSSWSGWCRLEAVTSSVLSQGTKP